MLHPIYLILFLYFLLYPVFLFSTFVFSLLASRRKSRLLLGNSSFPDAFLKTSPTSSVLLKKALKNNAFCPLKYISLISYNVIVWSIFCLNISINRDMTYARFLTAVSHLRNLIPTPASVASGCHILAGVGIFFGVLPEVVKCQTTLGPRRWAWGNLTLDENFVKGQMPTAIKGGLRCCPKLVSRER